MVLSKYTQPSRGEPELESKTNPIWYLSTSDGQREGRREGGEREIKRNRERETERERETKGKPLHMPIQCLWSWNLGAFIDSFQFHFIPVFISSSPGKKLQKISE